MDVSKVRDEGPAKLVSTRHMKSLYQRHCDGKSVRSAIPENEGIPCAF